MLITGDMSGSTEKRLIGRYDLPDIEVLMAGHHGSKTSSNDVLLSEITPEVVCVCCCAGSSEYTSTKNNQFPTQAMIDRVAKYTKNIYVTTLSLDGTTDKFGPMNGEIAVLSDGKAFSVHGSNNDTILMETDWFKANRRWPSNGVK